MMGVAKGLEMYGVAKELVYVRGAATGTGAAITEGAA